MRIVLPLVSDRSGRLLWSKTLCLLVAVLPGTVLALQWAQHDLGPRPITEALHGTGEWTVRFLLLALLVTPARTVLDWPGVVRLRRMLGVTAACYAGAHLTIFALDQGWNPLRVVHEIATRVYLTLGFVTWCGVMVLAWTSTDGWQRRLGRGWKRLHRWVYALTFLGLVHYGLQSKADVSAAIFAFGVYAWAMLWRAAPRRLWLLPGLALASGGAAALAEAVWYAVRNHVNPLLVLAANLNTAFGPRPAVWVALAGAGIVAAALLRRLRGGRRRGPAAVPAA
jgi:sulfoxide reductase heme-binding subunit YedZ